MERTLTELKNRIEDVLEQFSGEGYLKGFNFDEKDEEIYIVDELHKVFKDFSDFVSVYTIETITTFESCALDCGALMIAFVNPITGLETYLEGWEVR